MKTAKKNHVKQRNRLLIFSLIWLGACLCGTILFYVFDFSEKEFSVQYPNVFLEKNSLSVFQKSTWLFVISSSKQELLFILFLAVSSCFGGGKWAVYFIFWIRGFLFGFGGSLVAKQMSFPILGVVVIKQVLLTSAFLFYAASLYSDRTFCQLKPSSKKDFLLFSTLCETGLSLLIQYLFVFVLIKNHWI